MLEQDKTKTIGRPSIQSYACINTKKYARTLAQEFIEAEVGKTLPSFWNKLKGKKATPWEDLCYRAQYKVTARLAYSSPTLFIIEGATYNNQGKEASWTIEVHKKFQQVETTFIWVFGQENINGAI